MTSDKELKPPLKVRQASVARRASRIILVIWNTSRPTSSNFCIFRCRSRAEAPHFLLILKELYTPWRRKKGQFNNTSLASKLPPLKARIPTQNSAPAIATKTSHLSSTTTTSTSCSFSANGTYDSTKAHFHTHIFSQASQQTFLQPHDHD